MTCMTFRCRLSLLRQTQYRLHCSIPVYVVMSLVAGIVQYWCWRSCRDCLTAEVVSCDTEQLALVSGA
jgi:hypothetical protein